MFKWYKTVFMTLKMFVIVFNLVVDRFWTWVRIIKIDLVPTLFQKSKKIILKNIFLKSVSGCDGAGDRVRRRDRVQALLQRAMPHHLHHRLSTSTGKWLSSNSVDIPLLSSNHYYVKSSITFNPWLHSSHYYIENMLKIFFS